MSNVYIFKLKDNTAFKIGKSSNIIKRYKTLKSFYDFDDTVIEIDCGKGSSSYELEQNLHKICKNHHIIQEYQGGTEFFDMNIFEKTLSILIDICDLNYYKITHYSTGGFDLPNKKFSECDLILHKIGKLVRKKRLDYNRTQGELAKHIGVSSRSVIRVEQGVSVASHTLIKVLMSLNLDDNFLAFPESNAINNRIRASKKLLMADMLIN